MPVLRMFLAEPAPLGSTGFDLSEAQVMTHITFAWPPFCLNAHDTIEGGNRAVCISILPVSPGSASPAKDWQETLSLL
ncbi:MAG: hypothetical protein ACOYYS_17800 [Chloroflexota bacterium]